MDHFGWNRLINSRHGPMLANPLDKWIGEAIVNYSEYSEAEVEFLCQLIEPGDTVIEVGANIGVITVPLAIKLGEAGAIIAFEPQRLAYMTMCANAILGGLMNVRPMLAAVGRKHGTVRIPVIDPRIPGSSGGVGPIEDSPEEMTSEVHLIPMDDFPWAKPKLVKIDVEGMEEDVLVGGAKYIDRWRPILYLEADREEKTAAVTDLIDMLDYRMWWHFPPLFNPRNYARRGENIWGGPMYSMNLVCYPDEACPDMIASPYVEGFVKGDTWTTAIKRKGGLT